MSLAIELVGVDGSVRRVEENEFPLTLGGPGSDLQIAGITAGAPVGWIGLSEGDLFVQAGERDERVICNGARVDTSQWLQAGDEVLSGATRIDVASIPDGFRLIVSSAVEEVATEPPLVEEVTETSTTAGLPRH